MKKYLFTAIVITSILTIVLCTQAQLAAGQGGGRAGGGTGRGMGMATVTQRPDRAARIASIAELEKQVATLKVAIQKAPASDVNVADLKGEALMAYVGQINDENRFFTQIAAILSTMRPVSGSITTEQMTELTALAKEDKATKLTARLEALTNDAANPPTQATTTTRGGRGGRGGTGNSTPPAGN
jgi:hypothetical protein